MSDREITTRMTEVRDADIYLRRAMRAEADRDRFGEALEQIRDHALQYGPDSDTKMCDQLCADEMIEIAAKALRHEQ